MVTNDPDYEDIWGLYLGRCVNEPIHQAVCLHEITPRSKGRLAMAFWNRVPLCHECHSYYTPSPPVKQKQLKLKQKETIDFLYYGKQKTVKLRSGKIIKLPY